MKRFLNPIILLSCLFGLFGCNEDKAPTTITLTNITKEVFDYSGGLGSVVVDAGGNVITATASEDWCRIAVKGATVNFNLMSHYTTADRTVDITVESPGMEPLKLTITQTKFEGLVATPTTAIFSAVERTKTVAVLASDAYEFTLTENPGDQFSGRKTPAGVEFTSVKDASRQEVKGRAVISQNNGKQIIVTLIQPAKSTYDYILGTWQVLRNTSTLPKTDANIRFERRETDASFNVYVDVDPIKEIPFTAQFVDGKVIIQSGQKMGTTTDGRYVTLHFNGTLSGSGNYIFSTTGRVAWGATPQFDEVSHKMTLVLADNGQGKDGVANLMSIFGSTTDYFGFGSGVHIATYATLELTKSYTE